MRLNTGPTSFLTMFFVVFAMFVTVFMTAQDATASTDRFFGLGRGRDNDLGLFANQTTLVDVTLDPFGAVAVGATSNVPLNGLSFQPGTGTLYVSSSLKGTDGLNGGPGARSLYTMDPVTAATTLVGPFSADPADGFLFRSLTFDAGGTLYANDVEQLFTVDTATGLATPTDSPFLDGGGAAIESISLDPNTGILYGLSWNDVELFTIDMTTGAATSVGVFADLDAAEEGIALAGFAIDGAGNMYASTGSQQARVYSLDMSDFSQVLLGDVNDTVPIEIFDGSLAAFTFAIPTDGPTADFDSDGDVDGADFLLWQRDNLGASALADWKAEYGTVPAVAAVSAVPEPSALALLMLGAIGAVSLRKARRC